jgi:TolB-like protein
MRSSTNFSIKTVLVLITVLICLSDCVNAQGFGISAQSDVPLSIAVLPVYNLSGTPAPLQTIRQSLIDTLKKQEVKLLAEQDLEQFIFRHRLRYIGGISRDIAGAFEQETEAGAVLITSVELYNNISPPKIALACRLVSTGTDPNILWMESVGLAGHDAPGLLELSLIEDAQILMQKAITYLSTSLSNYLLYRRNRINSSKKRKKFGPKATYLSPILDRSLKYTVAILPFNNRSDRKYAGEIMSLHFIRQLRKIENFTVIEPGMVRQMLLRSRIIMYDGMSLSDADAIFARLHVDLVLGGKILDYQDYQGPTGKPKVGFSAQLIEKKSREMVWACQSYNEGDEGVWFFDRGKVNTAHAMANEMVQRAVETIFR